MLLTLVITLLLIGAAVVGSLYSNFLVFYENFAETDNYNKAYYASIAALERGELVVKQRDPGYIGSGGRKTSIGGTGQSFGWGSDGLITGFSYLSSGNDRRSEIFWSINSRTNRIPSNGNGNVELLLSAADSNSYNAMDYENAEVFLLYYDDSDPSKSPYSGGTLINSKPSSITAKIRIPGRLKDSGGDLNDSKALISTGATDDAIVDRQIRGNYNTSPFTIYATQSVTNRSVDRDRDTAIRESVINKGSNDPDFKLTFGNSWAPFRINSKPNTDIVTIISSAENTIKTTLGKFSEVFDKGTNLQLRFSLLNLLHAKEGKIIYPFLEYYVDFGSTTVSDKYYTINAEGSIGDFQVNTIIQKPTAKESILGNFTAVF